MNGHNGNYHNGNLEEQSDIHTTQITHFATIISEKELEDTLRRTQVATQKPGDNPSDYVDIDLIEDPTTTALFSKNIVCLDLQAPALPELMFYDLPGCINVYGTQAPGAGTPSLRDRYGLPNLQDEIEGPSRATLSLST